MFLRSESFQCIGLMTKYSSCVGMRGPDTVLFARSNQVFLAAKSQVSHSLQVQHESNSQIYSSAEEWVVLLWDSKPRWGCLYTICWQKDDDRITAPSHQCSTLSVKCHATVTLLKSNETQTHPAAPLPLSTLIFLTILQHKSDFYTLHAHSQYTDQLTWIHTHMYTLNSSQQL